jgi:hypothetical protein
VVAEFGAALEAVIEDLGEPLVPCDRDQAVAHAAGRRDPELLGEPTARRAVVRDRHDRSDEVAARPPHATQE